MIVSIQNLQTQLDQASVGARAWWQTLMTRQDLMMQLASALAILIVTLFISRWVSEGAKKLARRIVQNDADRTLPEFLAQIVRWMILTLGFVAIMNRLGIETASFITVLGAASLSIGLALQGTLGNVAAGLMLLFTKPYRIGDAVHIGDIGGTVHRLGVFSTEITSWEGLRVYVPNAKVFSNEISNRTTNGAIRIEISVDVGYDTDLTACLALLEELAGKDPDRLASHAPVASLTAFASSGITTRLWAWVPPDRAIAARTRLMVAIKAAFDAAGIEIPYPHQVAISMGDDA